MSFQGPGCRVYARCVGIEDIDLKIADSTSVQLLLIYISLAMHIGCAFSSPPVVARLRRYQAFIQRKAKPTRVQARTREGATILIFAIFAGNAHTCTLC